ncbi:MAG: aldo/keto reductase [Immundisolibacterales bacterium]|nr:aldo/keto reductase [Immundisolibacterales bacterium]
MNRRRFGRTGIEISELTLGAGFVGGLLIHASDDDKRGCIAACLEAGVNWIDTAAAYGDGESEKALNWLLGELPASERPHVSTKFRLDTARRDDFDGQIRTSIEVSLIRLGMDRVDLLTLHNPLTREAGPGTLSLDEAQAVADSLDRLRGEGLYDHVGFTALGDGPTVRAAVESGRFDVAQVYYNMLNPTAGLDLADDASANWSSTDFAGLLAACTAHDVGVMNIRILAAGVLATDVRHGREGPITANAEMEAEEARARTVRAALGHRGAETRAQTAIRFGLAQPAVSTIVFGVADLAQVSEALAASGLGPLEAEALAALRRAWTGDAFRTRTASAS